jgi:hypothetical protein
MLSGALVRGPLVTHISWCPQDQGNVVRKRTNCWAKDSRKTNANPKMQEAIPQPIFPLVHVSILRHKKPKATRMSPKKILYESTDGMAHIQFATENYICTNNLLQHE